ncbi:MAG: hypothetical protein JO042_03605 [Sinobacteraceae bacterium]|nr:hypothetical protein [Nevskiaceae bacterium]
MDAEKLPAAYLEDPPKKDPRKAYSPELPAATTAPASAETTKLGELDTTTLAELDAAALLEGDTARLELDTARLPSMEESPAAKNVAQILQDSLANDPHRVDIRIKLLEIYHHEALGNRAEFNSVLNSLVADSRMLTPAQRSHVEKLQRTLGNEGSEATTELITKAAS